MLQSPGSISYLLPVLPGEPEFSPFQGFNSRVGDFVGVAPALVHLPSNVMELWVERERAITLRARGAAPFHISFIEAELLQNRLPLMPFPCLVSIPSTHELVSSFVEKYPYPVLHLTTKAGDTKALLLTYARRTHVLEWLPRIRSFYAKHGREHLLSYLPLDEPITEGRRSRSGGNGEGTM